MIRIFFGLELPDEVKEKLSKLPMESGVVLEGARWIPKRNLHLTLKFIGNVDMEMVALLKEAVKRVVEDIPAFTITLGRSGAFPSPGRARILWYGVRDMRELVSTVARRIDDAVAPHGFPPEARRFHPHITLARLKVPENAHEAVDLMNAKLEGVEIQVNSVALFESKLERSGAEYAVIERFPLKPVT